MLGSMRHFGASAPLSAAEFKLAHIEFAGIQ